jgi:D-methionine transport system ATP-binding protein
LNARLNLTMVVITHEMSVVRELCDRVAVIDDGLIVETGEVFNVFVQPQHPTTQSMVAGEIEANLPKSLRKIIKPTRTSDSENPVVKIMFIGPTSHDPIISQLNRVTGIDFSIMSGQVEYIQDQPFGILFCEARGGIEAAEKGISFVQSRNLTAEVIGYVEPDHRPLG